MMIEYGARMIWRWHGRRLAWTPAMERLVRSADVWAPVPWTLEVQVQSALGVGSHGWAVERTQRPCTSLAGGWRRGLPSVSVAATVALGLVGAGYLGLIHGNDVRTVALSGSGTSPTASALADLREKSGGVEITLRSATLPPAPAGRYYEGWVKGAQGMVSVGTFHLRQGSGKVVLWSGVDLDKYPAIAVTLESEDDDPASSEQVVVSGVVLPVNR
ncbi:anti-sigma factor [Kribbella sp. NPDC051770]|uniref:anti-sigma factor n=1 Tax=Kribbella sp. NPDC051770 TaxID=3155413 RepID=UPI0034326D95